MISFDHVTIRYTEEPPDAVHDVSFVAERGVVTAVVGPNGSGKSTLVRALLQRVPLVAGAISVDDTDVRSMQPTELARKVAVVTQREDSLFVRKVREYVALGRFPHRARLAGGPTATDETAASAAAARAGIGHLLDRSTDTLSGGEWQRVRIARALAQGGGAMVLDEPTAFLDIAHEMQIFELSAELARRGLAVLVVSHQLNLVARFASRVVLLHHGRVAAEGHPRDVMRGDLLEAVYEWPLVVTHDPAVGAPALVPLRHPG